MWQALRHLIPNNQAFIQAHNNVIKQQLRTTFILKRKFAPKLHKKDMKPKPLRSRNYVYDLVKDTSIEKHSLMKLILTANVEGLGNKGDLVEVKPTYGYNNLLLLKKAVYATDENVQKFANLELDDEDRPSSPFVPLCMQSMSKMTLSVVMNKESVWTLKPWHIKVSFRKCGWEVPEEAIILPEEPIQGPDLNLENKEFYVTVEFSPKERQQVKCRIHHWSTDSSDRLPYVKEFWKIPTESVFENNEQKS